MLTVTATLKGILTAKRIGFDSDSKYVKFIKFKGVHKKLRAWENLPDLKKGQNNPKGVIYLDESLNIEFSISENPTIEVSSP